MSDLSDRQGNCLDVIADCRGQRLLLETVDGGEPSRSWTMLTAIQLTALVYSMKDEFAFPATAVVEEFCNITGLDFDVIEENVLRLVLGS